MNLQNVTALVSGDYLGGLASVSQLNLPQAAPRCTSASPGSANPKTGQITEVHLDVLSADTVSESRHLASDVNLLINITGAPTGAALITGAIQAIRQDMESFYFGTLRLVQAFAPVIERNGGGVVCNVLPLPPGITVPAEWIVDGGQSSSVVLDG
ncbi:hypothetical protein KL953_13090 [Mycolicibacterium goodii]|uniref:hypothetical protein n=1 Tax=Mycolicibacterium goodii TaxID=134601 RepID=UPI001BDC4D4C|nr:hypothetical protein [Mycolicibacterium goodii]MBU8809822.1 hypothetical protein [Mycolicibacterium goodii]ULN49502.1 hypothetical protein MI170_09230 [Mycolicibacterium goodii]